MRLNDGKSVRKSYKYPESFFSNSPMMSFLAWLLKWIFKFLPSLRKNIKDNTPSPKLKNTEIIWTCEACKDPLPMHLHIYRFKDHTLCRKCRDEVDSDSDRD